MPCKQLFKIYADWDALSPREPSDRNLSALSRAVNFPKVVLCDEVNLIIDAGVLADAALKGASNDLAHKLDGYPAFAALACVFERSRRRGRSNV
jgi:hypothetical protein